jgi:lysine-specific histone demethylase 1
VVIGAGMAGLAAARQLHFFGYDVIVLEARDRLGGRINTDISMEGAVDLGASILTGMEGNPLTLVCKQLNTKLHQLNYECPIYDYDGVLLDQETDRKMESEFNRVLTVRILEVTMLIERNRVARERFLLPMLLLEKP